MTVVGGGVIDPSVVKIKYTVNIRWVGGLKRHYNVYQIDGHSGWWDINEIPPGRYKFSSIHPSTQKTIEEEFTITAGVTRYPSNTNWFEMFMAATGKRPVPKDFNVTVTDLNTNQSVTLTAKSDTH